MDTIEFLKKIIDELPSNIYDSNIYISDNNENEYRINNITNNGSNDGIFIEIEKI